MLPRPKNSPLPVFPAFLLPTLKIPFFRRRQSSITTTSSAASNNPPSLSSSPTSTEAFPSSPTAIPPGGIEPRTHQQPPPGTLPATPAHSSSLPGPGPTPRRRRRRRLVAPRPDVLRCRTCGADLAYGLQIVSKGFTGRHGRALLVGAPQAAPTPSCPGSLGAGAGCTGDGDGAGIVPGHHALAHDSANLVNVTVGSPEQRNLVTGSHVVADIRCAPCGVTVGWKYVDAREQAQKYKVGKFILETERTVLVRCWEDGSGEEGVLGDHFYSSSAPVGSGGGKKSGLIFGRRRRKESTSSDGPGCAEAFVEAGEEESSATESEEEIAFDSEDEDECEDIFAGVWDAAIVVKRRGAMVGRRHDSKKARAARGR